MGKTSKKHLRAKEIQKQDRIRKEAKKLKREKKAEKRKRAKEFVPDAVEVPTPTTPVPEETPEPQVAKNSLAELEALSMFSLKETAKELGITGYSKFNKDDLVGFIYQHDKNLR